jgi:hypothetical protein
MQEIRKLDCKIDNEHTESTYKDPLSFIRCIAHLKSDDSVFTTVIYKGRDRKQDR